MAELPRILKQFSLYVDGRGYAGKIDTLTLPELTRKTEDHRPGGLDMPIRYDMGMEPMECTFSLVEYDANTSALFGLADMSVAQLTARGALRRDGDSPIAIVIVMRGAVSQLTKGEWKGGEMTTLTHKVDLRYYKETIDGQDVVEIDSVNNKRIINGVDQMEQIRNIIGE